MSAHLPNRPVCSWFRPRGFLRTVAVAVSLCLIGFSARAETTVKDYNGLPIGASMAGSYLAGRHAQAERDLGLAADLLIAVLGSDPENTDLMRRAFALLAMEGRFADALPLARKLVEKEGPDPLISLFVAAEHIKGKRLDDALGVIGALSSDGLDAYTTPIFTAWILEDMGRTDEALATLAPLEKTDGAKVLYHMHAGLIAGHARRMDAAGQNFLKALEEPNGASIRLVEIAADHFKRMGNPEKAKALITDYLSGQAASLRAVALERLADRGGVGLEIRGAADGIAEGLFGLGNSVRQQAGGDTAMFLGRLALYLRPGFDMVYVMLGEILETEGQYGRAIKTYRQVDKDSAFSRSAQIRIADALDRLDRVDEAIAALKAMAKKFPNDPDPLVDLADILRGRERFDEAAKAYDQAIKLTGTLGPEHWRLLYARGIARERIGDWAGAEKDFLQALEYRPNQPFVLNYLGYSWIDQGINLDRALEMIRKAVSLRPTDGYIVDSLGWGLYQTGKYDEAVREMERAVELRPQDPIINDHLGDTYWQVGRKREARFQWRRSLSLDPDDDLIRQLEQKLEKGVPPAPGAASTNG